MGHWAVIVGESLTRNSPAADLAEFNLVKLKASPRSDLNDIAASLRCAMIDMIRQTGGHYGAALGVVELTVALHWVFDSPRDTLLWDTGHQSYPHKVLTGRGGQMASLRTEGGISTFPVPHESPHDPLGVGHAGTSIAAGAAFLMHGSSDHWVVPIIGDAALATGPALEAALLAKRFGTHLCVIVNDNGYSIAPSVSMLSRQEPAVAALAAACGLRYVGPDDGHDAVALAARLEEIRALGEATLLHVRTDKGHGDPEATSSPTRLHTLADQLLPGADTAHRKLSDFIAANGTSRLFVTAGMGMSAGFAQLEGILGGRYVDLGIAEQTCLTFAAASGLKGRQVFVHIYATFLQRAVGALIHDVGLHSTALTLLIDRCGLAGEDGPTHHGIYDLALLKCCSGLEIQSVASESAWELVSATTLDDPERKLALRIFKGPLVSSHGSPRPRSGAIVHGEGGNAIILCHGRILHAALEARSLLQAQGVDVEVTELTQLHPLKPETLAELGMTGKSVVMVEEHVAHGSVGEALRRHLADLGVADFQHLAIPDAIIPMAPYRRQWELAGIAPKDIADAVLAGRSAI